MDARSVEKRMFIKVSTCLRDIYSTFVHAHLQYYGVSLYIPIEVTSKKKRSWKFKVESVLSASSTLI